MQIHFLGVGEACDGNQPNTSILLKSNTDSTSGRILLDCGFSVPHRYFLHDPSPEELEILWISHFHGDHFLGTPLLLLWFWEMDRQKPLHILGPPGIEAKIIDSMELAYPNLLSRLGFKLIFINVEPGELKNLSDSKWLGAYNEHSQPCLSLRLELNDKVIFYSGDGRPTPKTQNLAEGCDIIIHEAYGFEDTTPGHGSIATCLDFARNAKVKRIALVHMQRDIRQQSRTAIESLGKKYSDLKIMLPEKGSIITL
ncbi:MAG: MBL fold metallo-hydrolase [Deltaproteobacteria bacterium]|nr:MAG: MBL fold metallo-hydrolase [Deltaproteobacteria bacterium]